MVMSCFNPRSGFDPGATPAPVEAEPPAPVSIRAPGLIPERPDVFRKTSKRLVVSIRAPGLIPERQGGYRSKGELSQFQSALRV